MMTLETEENYRALCSAETRTQTQIEFHPSSPSLLTESSSDNRTSMVTVYTGDQLKKTHQFSDGFAIDYVITKTDLLQVYLILNQLLTFDGVICFPRQQNY